MIRNYNTKQKLNPKKAMETTNQQEQQQGDRQADEMAGQQEALRRVLGKLMLQMDEILGSIPPAMGKADPAMEGARQSLGRGDRAGAVPQQTEALEQLRQATEGLAEQLGRRMHGKQGMSIGRQGEQLPGNRDPFGRRRGEDASGELDDGGGKVFVRTGEPPSFAGQVFGGADVAGQIDQLAG